MRHASLLIFGLQKAVIERGLGAAKRDEQGGIELSGVGFQDESLGLHVSQAGFVDKLGAQGIIDIGNRDNSRRKRNGVAGQSVGIPAAVPTLVAVAAAAGRPSDENQSAL